MKALAVIPSRYASTRFPGKPLALLGGHPIVEWVWRRASEALGEPAIVATDNSSIYDVVKAFGGRVMMTRSDHRSGTDRCGEVAAQLNAAGEHYDIIVNVQGDEPFVRSEQLQALVKRFEQPEVQIATLRTPITESSELLSPNNVKVVATADGKALYFSRQALPYIRGAEQKTWASNHLYYKHVGVYAFRNNILQQLTSLPTGMLEQCESLEQLRWLEQGYNIYLCDTTHHNIGIDTPADLQQAEKMLDDDTLTMN